MRRREREEWEREVTARLDELERKFATMHGRLEDAEHRLALVRQALRSIFPDMRSRVMVARDDERVEDDLADWLRD